MSVGRQGLVTRRAIPIVLGLVVAALYIPAIVSVGLRTDLGGHLLHAQQLELVGSSWSPYYMFEQLTVIVRALLPFSALNVVFPAAGTRQATWEISGVLVMAGAVVATAELMYFRLLAASDRPAGRARGWTIAAVSVGLMLIAPLTILTWSNHQLIAGYIAVTQFDAATTNLLKPFALLLFWFLTDRIDRDGIAGRDVWMCAGLSVLSFHAKPSLAVVLVPAMLVFLVARQAVGRSAPWRFVGLGFILPTVLFAVVQGAGSVGSAGIAFDPLATVGGILDGRGLPVWAFAPLLLLSCAFPIAVAVAYWRCVLESPSLTLAWLIFAAGVGQFYLFRITGRVDFGDLAGAAQIGLFILYFESTRVTLLARWGASGFYPVRTKRPNVARRVLLPSLFVLQVACGVVLLAQEIRDPAAWW